MSTAKQDFQNLENFVEKNDEPEFEVLEVFLQSPKRDPLIETDEFLQHEENPYYTFDEIQEETGLTEEQLEEALYNLTGRTERTGYLWTDDHTRRTGFHEPHDNGRMTDADIQRMNEYKRKIDEESPDQDNPVENPALKLGGKVDELDTLIKTYQESPEAAEVYKFVTQHEDEDDYGLEGREGVTLKELENEFPEYDIEVITSDLINQGVQYDDPPQALEKSMLTVEAAYRIENGEPELSTMDKIKKMAGIRGEYSEEELQPYQDEGVRTVYSTNTRDLNTEKDWLKEKITERFAS